MDKRKLWVPAWVRHADGWWQKTDWCFWLKFTEIGQMKVEHDTFSELQLEDVVRYVTHVRNARRIDRDELGITALFNAMKLIKPCLVQYIDMDDLADLDDYNVTVIAIEPKGGYYPRYHPNAIRESPQRLMEDFQSLAIAIASGCLLSLRWLFLSEGDLTVAKAIAAGRLPSLQELTIGNVALAAWECYVRAFHSENLPNLSCLYVENGKLDNSGYIYLGLAMRSGQLKNLKELVLFNTRMKDNGLIALVDSSEEGLLPNLTSLNLANNSIGDEGIKALACAIGAGEFKNLAELDLSFNEIADEGLIALANSFQQGLVNLLPTLSSLKLSSNSFVEVGILSLAEALTSGRLDSLKVLELEGCFMLSNPHKVATAFVSAYFGNLCLTVDVKFEWFSFPKLDRRREELIERNSRNRDILASLGSVPKVQATFAKVYICGSPGVGKTTLRRTLQRSFWKSLFTWERRPHQEKQTRGIDVSQVPSKGNNSDEDPLTLLVWDMAGQEDFHLVHNAFFPDLSLAEGKATAFIVVCSSKNSLQSCKEQLEYWLRYIASSCDKTIQSPRHVFVVMNNIGGGRQIHRHAEDWKQVLVGERDTFEGYLKIRTDLFLLDVREFQQVKSVKSCLLQHSRHFLKNQEVPKISDTIQKNLSVWSRAREQFPVLLWTEFVGQVIAVQREPWPDHVIEAATKYLNEAGVVIYLHKEGVKLVVLDPNWLCREIIGKVFLPRDMASPSELLFREQVNQTTGSISISKFKKFFKLLKGEWNDAQVDDLIAILLWLGLCYKGKDENMFLPALIAEMGEPGEPWCSRIPVEHGGEQWVMGFSVRHRENEVALAPISLWHRFQVDLAQTFKLDSQIPDSDFVAGKYFMAFVVDYMKVLIKVDANTDKPTFEEINIQVKPKFATDELDGTERKQRQVDLAGNLVERLLKLWNQVCPGVEYVEKVIWPWPASWSRPEAMPERNVEVAVVKKWVQERGAGRKMQWDVGSGYSITEDQLLSTKGKRDVLHSVEHSLSIVRHGMKEAVSLRIFPPGVLTDEVFFDEFVASDGVDMPTSSTVDEQDEMYCKLSKLLSKKLKPIDNKVDKLYKKLDNVEKLIQDGLGAVLKKQKQLLHKLQDTEKMFLEDRESVCPKFIYLGTSDSAWVTLKDALSLTRTVRLRFACEARCNNYKPHVDVRNQEGLDVSQLTDWARTVLPWLKVSLTVLFISAKVAANVVAPGVGLIMPGSVQWKQASSLSEGIALATGFSKDQLEKMIHGPELNAHDAHGDPQGLYKKSRIAISELLGGLKGNEFQEKIGLRKVALKYPDGTLHGVAWICSECFEKFPMGMVSEL